MGSAAHPFSHKHEESIVWLRDKQDYEYLREYSVICHFRQRFALKQMDPARCTDGGKDAHIVAYAILKKDAPHDTIGPGYFMRRYWWVKSYDRFKGCTRKDCYEPWNAPCEAVDVNSIAAGVRSKSYVLPQHRNTNHE